MNDILFGNNNSKVITKLSKRYFKKNKVRNLAALLAIILTAFLFTSITSLAFNMASSIQLSLQMQKGSKADGTLGYMTEEQYEQLVNSDFVEQAGHRRIIGYASNTSSHSIEINYADSVQQELTFCVPTHGTAPEKANEIATTDLALKALGVESEIGAEVPLEFELRGKTYHYDMVLSGWWEASNDSVSVATVSEQFIKENPDVVQNTYAVDHEISGVTFSDVVLKNKANIQQQLNEFVYSIGGNPENMGADNFILASENQMSQGLTSSESIVLAVVFILMFVVCGYLLIYNIFDISVMQDVRQYGLLRTIGTSTRQIKGIVNRQAVWLTLIALPIGLIAGFFAGWGERSHRHPGGAGRRGRAGRLPELKRIGKPHKNPQKQNAENIPSPCWGTRYLLHIYHQSNIKLSSAIRCSMHQDVGRFCAAGPASCRSIDIIIV